MTPFRTPLDLAKRTATRRERDRVDRLHLPPRNIITWCNAELWARDLQSSTPARYGKWQRHSTMATLNPTYHAAPGMVP